MAPRTRTRLDPDLHVFVRGERADHRGIRRHADAAGDLEQALEHGRGARIGLGEQGADRRRAGRSHADQRHQQEEVAPLLEPLDRIGDVGHGLHGAKLAQRPDRLPAHGGITVAEELHEAGDRGGVTQSAGEPAGVGALGRGAGSQSGELAPGCSRQDEHVADPVGFACVETGERLEAGNELQAILGMHEIVEGQPREPRVPMPVPPIDEQQRGQEQRGDGRQAHERDDLGARYHRCNTRRLQASLAASPERS